MTQTAERADRDFGSPLGEPVPRRPLTSRLSLGHLVMIVAGLAAFLLVLTVLRDRGETVLVAVAGQPIQAGTVASDDMFEFTEVAADGRLTERLMAPEVATRAVSGDWIAVRSIAAGEPITLSDFRAGTVDAELRAMSIPIAAGNAVDGAIRQGDRVDVIVVRSGVASYVTVDTEVISVSAGASGLGGTGALTITVAVDADTSLRLASALNDGSIEIVRSNGASAADIGAAYDPAVVPEPDE